MSDPYDRNRNSSTLSASGSSNAGSWPGSISTPVSIEPQMREAYRKIAKWRQEVQREVFRAGMKVFPDMTGAILGDPEIGLIDLYFVDCHMSSVERVDIAFAVLADETLKALTALGRPRAAFLVDIAGIDFSPQVREYWAGQLRRFMDQFGVALPPNTGNFLTARYNTASALLSLNHPEHPVRTQEQNLLKAGITLEAILNHMTANVFTFREEAIAAERAALAAYRARQQTQQYGAPPWTVRPPGQG